MVQSPGLRVSVRRGDTFAVQGVHSERARHFAETVLLNLCKKCACEHKREELRRHLQVEVEYAPREHIGMGVGTQLGLSIAAAICSACEQNRGSAIDLAMLARRSARSGIGTFGFDQGGLLIDTGQRGDSSTGRRISRAEMPADWRFVLLWPRTGIGISGEAETAAFETLAPTRLEIANQLRHLALSEMAPAASEGDFARFGRALYSFNQTAGSYFAAAQGGIFASKQTARLVERLRLLGVEGVGQSSWGPTVFALCGSEPAAQDLLRQAQPLAEAGDYECLVSAPANQGAVIEVLRETERGR